MWQHALYHWINASKAAQENTKLLLADPVANTQECVGRMMRLEDTDNELAEFVDDPNLPAQVTRYLKARAVFDERSTIHSCMLHSDPTKSCAECKAAATEYFTSRDWLRESGLELLRS